MHTKAIDVKLDSFSYNFAACPLSMQEREIGRESIIFGTCWAWALWDSWVHVPGFCHNGPPSNSCPSVKYS